MTPPSSKNAHKVKKTKSPITASKTQLAFLKKLRAARTPTQQTLAKNPTQSTPSKRKSAELTSLTKDAPKTPTPRTSTMEMGKDSIEDSSASAESDFEGFADDAAWERRRLDREQHNYAVLDENFGRFVLRSCRWVAEEDLRFLNSGVNKLLDLAREVLEMQSDEFLVCVFKGNWNSAAPPGQKPSPPKRISEDASVPCGNFSEDAYTKPQRKDAMKAGVHPSTLFLRPDHPRRANDTVFLKVCPGIHAPTWCFVCKGHKFAGEWAVRLSGGNVFGGYLLSALRNYDSRDKAACDRFNQATLVWLARYRLHRWYNEQDGDQETPKWNIREEEPFLPMAPLRTVTQVFGNSVAIQQQIAGGLGITPEARFPNGVRPNGAAVPVESHRLQDIYNDVQSPSQTDFIATQYSNARSGHGYRQAQIIDVSGSEDGDMPEDSGPDSDDDDLYEDEYSSNGPSLRF